MKKVTFYLGPANNLASRRIVVTKRPNGVDRNPSPSADSTLAGNAEWFEITLQEDIYIAELTDTASGGSASRPIRLLFSLGQDATSGPFVNDGSSLFGITNIEEI